MTSPAEPTTLAGLSFRLLTGLEALGVQRADMLRAARLDERMLSDPDARIPSSRVWAVWRLAISRLPDQDLGLRLAENLRARELGLVGYVMSFSRTVRHALQRLTRYSHILSETLQYRLEESRSQTRLALERDPRFDELRHPIDLRLAAVVAVLRDIAGRSLTPLEARFPYARPARTSQLARCFRAPLVFGCREAMLLYRMEDLDRGVAAGDERLAGYLDRLARDTLRSLGRRGSLSDRVNRFVWSELADGTPTLERAASTLGLSTRTLQRRLREEGTTYAALIETLRRDLAGSMLRDRGLAVYEVGFMLGYSDPTSFHRAFRRWTSCSPGQYRRETRASP